MQAFHSQFTDFNLMVEDEILNQNLVLKRQIKVTSRLTDCPDLFNQKWAYLSSIQMYIQWRIDTIIEAFFSGKTVSESALRTLLKIFLLHT